MNNAFSCPECGHPIDGPDTPARRALVDYHMRNKHGMTHRVQKASGPHTGRKDSIVGDFCEAVCDAIAGIAKAVID